MTEYETYPCEWDGCERDDFSSEKGMKQHHKIVHGESIAGIEVECDWCGDSTRVTAEQNDSGRTFCDKWCYGEWQSEHTTGENNPLWGGRIEVECDWCGEVTERMECHVRGEHNFCDYECHGKYRSEHMTGESSVRWEGGPIEVECAWCGAPKEVQRSRDRRNENHFCDIECHGKWMSDYWSGGPGDMPSGERHPLWARVTEQCDQCGGEYLVAEGRSESSRFCTQDCYGEWLSENRSGEDHPMWDQVEMTCGYCDEKFQVPASRAEDARFCGHDCVAQWVSENLSGENHPNWNGGTFPYGPGWNDAKKEQVRERDGRCCRECGRTEEEHVEKFGSKHAVHHIQRARSFDDPEERNAPENLITLCRWTCHSKWERMSPLRPQVGDTDGATSD